MTQDAAARDSKTVDEMLKEIVDIKTKADRSERAARDRVLRVITALRQGEINRDAYVKLPPPPPSIFGGENILAWKRRSGRRSLLINDEYLQDGDWKMVEAYIGPLLESLIKQYHAIAQAPASGERNHALCYLGSVRRDAPAPEADCHWKKSETRRSGLSPEMIRANICEEEVASRYGG